MIEYQEMFHYNSSKHQVRQTTTRDSLKLRATSSLLSKQSHKRAGRGFCHGEVRHDSIQYDLNASVLSKVPNC